MSQPIIEVENLSKLYQLGRIGATTLRESAERWWRRMQGLKHPQTGPDANTIWSLKDVSFSVNEGEIVGIIGRNGAGKSTLLKILSRITEPTSGRAILRGRVASLLEVGTGFHPELTGRENVYLNGAILGMRKREIARKFDEIVSFAEVERFIDTPVKHYSSGMSVRLGFAVAAHLEPEILFVDEVLAVGDFAFQKKCLGKMGEVAKKGRTIFFVSHNMDAIASLCSHGILMVNGRVSAQGSCDELIRSYLANAALRKPSVEFFSSQNELNFLKLTVKDKNKGAQEFFYAGQPIQIVIDYEVTRPLKSVQIVLQLYTDKGVHVLSSADHDEAAEIPARMPGRYRTEMTIPAPLLAPGGYEIEVACGIPNIRVIDRQRGPFFEIRSEQTPFSTWSSGRRGTILALVLPWKTVNLQ